MNQQPLDPFPIVGVFLVFSVVSLVVFEGGFRVGRWWQNHTAHRDDYGAARGDEREVIDDD